MANYHSELLVEALHFLHRDDLDSCELVCSQWRKLIGHRRWTLPLRAIHTVFMDFYRQRVPIDFFSGI